jgi:hypothetical protein
MKRVRSTLLLAAALSALPTGAGAQPIDPQARAAARSLVEDADRLWNDGDYAGALERFTRAHGLVDAPTIAIRQAECLEKLGRIVEASETYMAVSWLKLEPGAPDAFKRAVASAIERANALRGRMSMLELTIEGEDVEGAKVLVDGRAIHPALVGMSFPLDPGQRVIEVVKGNRKVSETVTIGERESKRLTLKLPPPKDEPVAPPSTKPQRSAELTSTQATWGWVTVGLGLTGLAVGTTTGFIAMGQRRSLDEECDDKRCPQTQKSNVDNYNSMRTVSTIGFGIGGVGVIAGLTLLLTTPAPEPEQQAGIRPWLGLASAGVEGRF